MFKYIIMCGGNYDKFEQHKSLTKINNERLVERTIRLLKENNINDIYISSNEKGFEEFTNVLHHENSFKVVNDKVIGYWIDAYYPTDEPVVYLHGDVYYSGEAIKKIIQRANETKVNVFIGNEVARNKEHKNWGEPFGWIVVNQQKFHEAIKKTKELQDNGKLERGYALSWELYRVMNGTDPNYMLIDDNNYLSIDDETIDIDNPWQIEELKKKVSDINAV